MFYVSGHGFGHTSRSIEVIEALLNVPGTHVVVKTSAPRRLFERTLGGRIDFETLQCDAGMVQVDSLNVDTEQSLQQALEFQRRLPHLAACEAEFLRAHGASVVAGDIPPVAFVAAGEAGIPSVAIGNFTWDWIYESLPTGEALARDIRSAYQRASAALRLPMSAGFEGLTPIVRDIPFIARHSLRAPDEVRRILGVPSRAAGKPLVLVSFGGYGVSGFDSAAVARLSDYIIATTDSPAQEHTIQPSDGLVYISERRLYDSGLRYEDLVRAADVVVTKPGYGIISESIANDTAILYTSRGQFREYGMLVDEMPKYLRVQYIEQEDLLSGRWKPALERLLDQPPPPERPDTKGAEVAAAAILSL